MSSDDTITVRVKPDTWEQLHSRKGPGDSFDDIIAGLLERCGNDDGDDRARVA